MSAGSLEQDASCDNDHDSTEMALRTLGVVLTTIFGNLKWHAYNCNSSIQFFLHFFTYFKRYVNSHGPSTESA
jgi:hypothetical protein